MHEINKTRRLEYSESFFKSTTSSLPKNLLRICVEHVLDNKGLMISSEQLNTIHQKNQLSYRAALLDDIRKEREANRINMAAATKLVRWIGPVHWKAALECSSDSSGLSICPFGTGAVGLGICPGSDCGMLIYKVGGCTAMNCFCGRYFYWHEAELDVKGVAEACHLIVQHRQHRNDNSNARRRFVSELVFRERVMESAERIMSSTMASSRHRRRGRGIRRRPFLQLEDHNEILDDVRYHMASYSLLYEDDDPKCCDLSPTTLPRENVSSGTDESPSTYSPTDRSLSNFIVVPTQDENPDFVLLPTRDESPNTAYQGQHWEECSYSVLSGCETVHSINELSDAGECEIMMFSYCTAVKLGIAAAKRAKEQSLEAMALATFSPTSSIGGMVVEPKESTQKTLVRSLASGDGHYYANESYGEKGDSPEDCDIDDVLWSIYDAAKSGHGGRLSSQFRGNSRTQRSSWYGGGEHRRPNWTRKRRKDHKIRGLFHRTYSGA